MPKYQLDFSKVKPDTSLCIRSARTNNSYDLDPKRVRAVLISALRVVDEDPQVLRSIAREVKDINALDVKGLSLLHIMILSANLPAIKALHQDIKVDISQLSQFASGGNCLHLAIYKLCEISIFASQLHSIVDYLLQHKIDTRMRDAEHNTALAYGFGYLISELDNEADADLVHDLKVILSKIAAHSDEDRQELLALIKHHPGYFSEKEFHALVSESAKPSQAPMSDRSRGSFGDPIESHAAFAWPHESSRASMSEVDPEVHSAFVLPHPEMLVHTKPIQDKSAEDCVD